MGTLSMSGKISEPGQYVWCLTHKIAVLMEFSWIGSQMDCNRVPPLGSFAKEEAIPKVLIFWEAPFGERYLSFFFCLSDLLEPSFRFFGGRGLWCGHWTGALSCMANLLEMLFQWQHWDRCWWPAEADITTGFCQIQMGWELWINAIANLKTADSKSAIFKWAVWFLWVFFQAFPVVKVNVDPVSFLQAQRANRVFVRWGKLATTLGAIFEKAPSSSISHKG